VVSKVGKTLPGQHPWGYQGVVTSRGACEGLAVSGARGARGMGPCHTLSWRGKEGLNGARGQLRKGAKDVSSQQRTKVTLG
jgi:hypothetical protein